jgi:DNA primase
MYEDYLETIEHKKRGDEYQLVGECPFCGAYKPDDTRIYYNKRKNIGVCHHCGKNFRLVNYVMALEGICHIEATKRIKSEETGYVRTEKEVLIPSLYVPKSTIEIADSVEASDYCVSRGLTKEIISHFGLKFIPENETVDGRTHYVGKRIFIPILNEEGGFVFWQARDITGKAEMKYLFPRGVDKSQYIYNLHNVQRNSKYVILCEGIMDVYGWTKANKIAVALFGKYMSNAQYNLLVSYGFETIYVALDQDALKYSIDIQKRLGQTSRIKFIQMERDSDEHSKYELDRIFGSSVEYSWGNSLLTLLRSSAVGQSC